MDQERPPPPADLKPWYYQDWFLFPVFVFWPVWAVLILRSPWHNGLASGAVAWAMLMVGSYTIVWQQLVQTGRLNDITITLALPGLVLTVVTQALWFRDKQKLQQGDRQVPEEPPAPASKLGKTRQGRQRRRNRHSRSSRRR